MREPLSSLRASSATAANDAFITQVREGWERRVPSLARFAVDQDAVPPDLPSGVGRGLLSMAEAHGWIRDC